MKCTQATHFDFACASGRATIHFGGIGDFGEVYDHTFTIISINLDKLTANAGDSTVRLEAVSSTTPTLTVKLELQEADKVPQAEAKLREVAALIQGQQQEPGFAV